jgi:TRAP-type C4-dicarboxylate transport system permease small subunit
MTKLIKILDKGVDLFAFFLVLAMTCVVFVQITNRYFFGIPLSWTEEVARIIFIWMVFTGAYLALKLKAHISIESFAKRYLSDRIREKVMDVSMFFITFALTYLLITSIRVLQGTFKGTTPVLEISFGWVHLAIPLFTVCMIIYLISQMFKMGVRRFVPSFLMSIGIFCLIYVIFGITVFSGPMIVLVVVVLMGSLILFGMPIVFSMGIACVMFLVLYKMIPSLVLHTRMIGGIDSFPLLAVPFWRTGQGFCRPCTRWIGNGRGCSRILFFRNFRIHHRRRICHRVHACSRHEKSGLLIGEHGFYCIGGNGHGYSCSSLYPHGCSRGHDRHVCRGSLYRRISSRRSSGCLYHGSHLCAGSAGRD